MHHLPLPLQSRRRREPCVGRGCTCRRGGAGDPRGVTRLLSVTEGVLVAAGHSLRRPGELECRPSALAVPGGVSDSGAADQDASEFWQLISGRALGTLVSENRAAAARNSDLEPELERPVRLQVVAGPRFEPAPCQSDLRNRSQAEDLEGQALCQRWWWPQRDSNPCMSPATFSPVFPSSSATATAQNQDRTETRAPRRP